MFHYLGPGPFKRPSKLTSRRDLRMGDTQEAVIEEFNKKKGYTLRAEGWNVRSLLSKGILENSKLEMDRFTSDVVGLSEFRRKQANGLVVQAIGNLL